MSFGNLPFPVMTSGSSNSRPLIVYKCGEIISFPIKFV